MKAVAYTELLIMLRIVLGVLTLQNSLLSPILYAHFLRQRYYHSAFTKEAVSVVDQRIEKYVRGGAPPVVVRVWDLSRMAIGRWAGSTLVPQQPGAAGARRG
jgi:transmembrane protein 33